MTALLKVLLEETAINYSPDIAKSVKRVEATIRKEFKRLGPFSIEIDAVESHKVKFTVEMQRWLNYTDKDFDLFESELKSSIDHADTDSKIFKVELPIWPTGQYYEAILGGLRPGMTLKADAFFPMFEVVVTWKKMIKTGR